MLISPPPILNVEMNPRRIRYLGSWVYAVEKTVRTAFAYAVQHPECEIRERCFWSGVLQEMETKAPAIQLLYFNIKP